MPLETVKTDNKEVLLLGTAHVSHSSVAEVERAIEEHRPQVVAVELCQSRYDTIRNPNQWQSMDIVSVIKSKRAGFLFANLAMSSFQRRIGNKIGVKPGQEMIAAIEKAEELGIEIALIDRPIQITLQRAWRLLGFREKMAMIWSLITSIFAAEDFEEDEIEAMKEKDVLTAAVDEIARTAPTVKRVLIDERDTYMAQKINTLKQEHVLAVVGAGHVPGMTSQLPGNEDSLTKLSEVPEKGKSYAKWIIPLFFCILVGWGFFSGNSQQGVEMVKWWFISNAVFAALGAAIAFGHPLTILVAGAASPITSMNPTLAAGWFAGLTEAWLRKPKVADFESLHDDISGVTGFWRNPITRILMVVVLANLGSSMGANKLSIPAQIVNQSCRWMMKLRPLIFLVERAS